MTNNEDIKEQQLNSTNETQKASSYADLIERFRVVANNYDGLSTSDVYNAFMRAGNGLSNMPSLQNARVKAISSLPVDYTKEELGQFLRQPNLNEKQIRQTSEVLKWTSYPYFKIAKSYADIGTYHTYAQPLYIETEDAKKDEFKRESVLIDKILKAFNVKAIGHKIASETIHNGKVFYTPRYNIDKVHNKVNYIFMQRLPQDYCTIIGFNNISGYTISFDLMYFLQAGTDYTQYGDLFEPYMKDFSSIFEATEPNDILKKRKYIYASKDKRKCINIEKLNANGEGSPRLFEQNGKWCYYVTLPIDKVYTFEIDDGTSIVASPLSGLMQTFAQQSDYEAAQLSLVMNPLIKIFTGEMPYATSTGQAEDDGYRQTLGSRAMFEAFWEMLMAKTNTGGTAFFTAPVQNIKSHDYTESANANTIASSFNTYGMEKAGLTGLIPAIDNPHQGMAQYSGYLESQYIQVIYRGLERVINNTIESLNLHYEWKVNIFGSVYNDEQYKADALKMLDKGDLFAWVILAALDDVSINDKLSYSKVIKESELLDYLIPPQTAYTMSGAIQQESKASGTGDEGGRPTTTEQDKKETQISKTKEIETKEV